MSCTLLFPTTSKHWRWTTVIGPWDADCRLFIMSLVYWSITTDIIWRLLIILPRVSATTPALELTTCHAPGPGTWSRYGTRWNSSISWCMKRNPPCKLTGWNYRTVTLTRYGAPSQLNAFNSNFLLSPWVSVESKVQRCRRKFTSFIVTKGYGEN